MAQAHTKKKSEYDSIINDSYLAMYCEVENHSKVGYDAVLIIGDVHIYLLHEFTQFSSDTDQVPKTLLHKYSQQSVTKLVKRHIKLLKKNKKTNQQLSLQNKTTYYIGLSTLNVKFYDRSYSIDHQFGSQYFQEQCVFDYDNDMQVLQLFGIKSFISVLKLLNTPMDMLEFLKYHRQQLLKLTSYHYEVSLAHSFMRTASYFQRAYDIEEKLINMQLLDKHDPRLVKTIEQKPNAKLEKMLKKMHHCSGMWIRLIRQQLAKQAESNNDLPATPVKAINHLVSESMYTRLKIMEEVLDYAKKSKEERQNGHMFYQHSYCEFGNQYMLVMYSTNEDSWLSQKSIIQHHKDLLIDLNRELQTPVMKNLFLLGFDLSKVNKDGNAEVAMDIFHLSGTVMSDLEMYLHQKLSALESE